MTKPRFDGLALLLLGSVLFLVLGTAWERVSPNSMGDFKVVYYSARCLLQHGDPYKESDVLRVYREEGRERPSEPARNRLVMTRYFYLPTAFPFTVPFALLGFDVGRVLWMGLTAGSLMLAGFLMWDIGANSAPVASGALVGFFLANSVWLFMIGNSAGIAIGLCVIACWCFLKERFLPVGVLGLAISLAVKPHDAGLVWLFFFLAGGAYRKRALQTLVVIVVLGLPAVLWVTYVAPHWIQEMHANMLTFSAHGNIDDPGSTSDIGSDIDGLVQLQSVISVLWDNPAFYNSATYIFCGALLLAWAIATLRSRPSMAGALLALATIAPLSMLPLYHRQHDAKLLLLTIPACAMLWAAGGTKGWLALLVTGTGIALNGDSLSLIRMFLVRHLVGAPEGFSSRIQTVLMGRPVPIILLAMSIFYLWVYVRHTLGRDVLAEPAVAGKA